MLWYQSVSRAGVGGPIYIANTALPEPTSLPGGVPQLPATPAAALLWDQHGARLLHWVRAEMGANSSGAARHGTARPSWRLATLAQLPLASLSRSAVIRWLAFPLNCPRTRNRPRVAWPSLSPPRLLAARSYATTRWERQYSEALKMAPMPPNATLINGTNGTNATLVYSFGGTPLNMTLGLPNMTALREAFEVSSSSLRELNLLVPAAADDSTSVASLLMTLWAISLISIPRLMIVHESLSRRRPAPSPFDS